MALSGALAGVARVALRVDDSEYNRGLAQAEQRFHRTAHELEQESGKMARGVAAGTGAFHSLGRSIAFASGAFLGGAGFTAVARASIEQAERLEVGLRQLDAQVRANGQSVTRANAVFDVLKDRMARLGFTAAESVDAFTRLARATGDTVKAAQLMTLTADLARARHIDLSQAALLVGKVFDGNVAALNRYGIHIAKGTSATDALRIAQQKLGGQAEAAVTPMQKLHATVTNLEATVGEALLPSLNRTVDALSRWITTGGRQEKLQHDITEAVRVGTNAFRTLANIIGKVDDVTGSFKHTLELLIGLKFASVVLGWAGALRRLAGAEALGGAVTKAGSLRAALLSLGNPEVLAALAATAGAVALLNDELSHHTEGNVRGPGGLPTEVFEQHGKWYQRTAVGRGGVVTKEITKAQAQALTGAPGSPTGSAAVMAAAAPFAGVPYQWGGGHGALPGPSFATGHGRSGLGLDCSGYARAVLANMGISVSGTAEGLLNSAKSHPSVSNLAPGDLVFYEGVHPQHVMVYIGNGQVIGETHTGARGPEIKSVSYLPITGTGRYWPSRAGGGAAPAGIPSGTPTAPAAAAKPQKADLTAMPAGLHLALGNARGDAQTQIKVLTEFEGILERRKAKAKTLADKADIQDEINNVLDQIGSIRDKQRKKKKAATPDVTKMPDRLRLEFEDAVGKKDAEAQVKILTEFLGVLEHRKRLAKTVAAKADIQAEINATRDQISGIRGKPAKAGASPDAGLLATIAAAVKSYTQTAGGVKGITIPGIGKILAPYKPAIDDWKKVYLDLLAKLKAARDRRAKLARSLATAQRAKRKNAALIKNLRARIAKLDVQIAELAADAGDALGEVLQLAKDAEDQAQQDAKEAESDAASAASGVDASGGGDIGGGTPAADTGVAAAAAPVDVTALPTDIRLAYAQAQYAGGDVLPILQQEQSLYLSRLDTTTDVEQRIQLYDALTSTHAAIASATSAQLTAIPAPLRLSLAQAQGRGDQTGIRSLLTQERDLIKARLAEASAIEDQISLTGTLNDLNAQLNDTTQQAADAMVSYLSAWRGLRAYESNIYDPQASLRGATINLITQVQPQESDPHLWSQAVQFELQSVLG